MSASNPKTNKAFTELIPQQLIRQSKHFRLYDKTKVNFCMAFALICDIL